MDPINKVEMIKVIKDAGIYEENMSKEQMEHYYKAVINSRDTSSILENDSQIINSSPSSPEDMFASQIDTYIQQSSPIKAAVETETQLEDSDIESTPLKPKMKSIHKKSTDKPDFYMDIFEETEDDSSPQDATRACFSFDDMPKDNGDPLEIIYREPKYINIQNSERFINADVVTKAKMLYNYHTEMEKLRSTLSRQSFFPAPRPKPIELTGYYNLFEAFEETEETYISRAGRQTKRKVYNDDDDEISTSPSSKKAKSKSVEKPKWQSKTKPVKKVEPVEELMESDTIEVVQKEAPRVPTRSKKPLSNAEIMNRSTLFKDSPSKRPTRSDKLFEKLIEEDIKKQREERALVAFEKTLNSDIESSQRESQNEEDDIQVTDDVYPKRVIPPIPTKRKPINSRTQQPKSNVKNPAHQKEIEIFEQVAPSTSRTDNSANVQCPICTKLFTEDVIEEHASNCGEEQIVTRNSSNVTKRTITCEICDKVIQSNFELHVSVCRKRQEKIDNERE